MTYTFRMPDIGEGVVEGEVVSWLKKEGDILKKDEPVLILMTDKATVELPTPYAGILSRTYYKPGEIAKKGLPLFDVSTEEKISFAEVHGSTALAENEMALTGIRRLMAKKMEESHAHIPSFSYFEKANASRLVQWMAKQEKTMTYMPFFIRALSQTIWKHPIVNASVDKERNVLIQHKAHNIGIAMNTPEGLIVPVLKGVENMTFNEVLQNYNALKEKAKTNQLSLTDMKEGTITLTNFGALTSSVEYATPIINYPEVAILALAYIQKEPIVENNEIVIADILHCSWSFDHRVIDGGAAAAILQTFTHCIENPDELL